MQICGTLVNILLFLVLSDFIFAGAGGLGYSKLDKAIKLVKWFFTNILTFA